MKQPTNGTIPVLMITYNRLQYTVQALQSLVESDSVIPIVIDNGSTDGTVKWLKNYATENSFRHPVYFNHENKGIAHAMNQFLSLTDNYEIVGKVDNDTIVPTDWAVKLRQALQHCHIVQAKHHIIPATNKNGWNGFIAGKKRKGSLIFNNYVGGSGILFWRSRVDSIPETKWKLGGWAEFQRRRPELTKAFYEDVEITLLDEKGYMDYPTYYQETGRL